MSDTIELWVVAETETEIETSRSVDGERSGGYTGPTLGSPKAITEKVLITRKRVPLDVQLLQAQMSGMLRVVNELFAQAEAETGMQLEEVELKVEINAEGQISLVGTGGKLGNTGGISIFVHRDRTGKSATSANISKISLPTTFAIKGSQSPIPSWEPNAAQQVACHSAPEAE